MEGVKTKTIFLARHDTMSPSSGMRSVIAALVLLMVACIGTAAERRGAVLDIYYIDTEGGQSTLFVGPTGESLLVDTGNPGERDLSRIAETLRSAGVTRIDHMWL